ncbi:MAG TPA: NADH-quinone oxidoreductase subunit J [Pirellulaceae bacterium]|nr:NADH-quinone oxidoreductase subunit J [Pirellulaceae bacterium]
MSSLTTTMLADSLLSNMLLLGAINWHSVFFFLFAAIACAFGAAVLFSSNVVRMAFYLIVSLSATAGLFFLAGSEFLGAMQIMIYVGGTLVLLIFGVMLTAQEAFVSMKTRGGEWVLGLIVGASFLLLLINAACNVPSWSTPRADAETLTAAVMQPRTTQMGLALSGGRVDVDSVANPTLRRGMSGYLLAFEAVGIHLLVVLVGAAYLSRSKRFIGNRAPAAVAYQVRQRKRSTLVSIAIGLGMAFNLALAVATLAGQSSFQNDYPELLIAPPSWLFPTVSLLFLLSVLLLAVVWGWQRWALFALPIVPVAQAMLLAQNGLDPILATVVGVVLLLPVVGLIGLLMAGKPSVWSQMD